MITIVSRKRPKRVLILGSGGREHALGWKMNQSPRVGPVYYAPGNAGTSIDGLNVDIDIKDFEAITRFIQREGIDLTVVGPEDPLIEGIVDHLHNFDHDIRVFGPTREAAQLEGSKIFAFLTAAGVGVPFAPSIVCRNFEEASRFLMSLPKDHPWVVKADGNALGKGALMCKNRDEALDGCDRIMVQNEFKGAGKNGVLIQEVLEGFEVSLLGICSGQDVQFLATSQDHKRVGEGDTGPNTGGMGCYSPVPGYTPRLQKFCYEKIFAPILRALDFTGVLYAGIMVTSMGPKVLEFNVRFGDPETQNQLPRMKSDLYELLSAAVDGTLGKVKVRWSRQKSVTVVAASGGYPGSYEKEKPITGITTLNGAKNNFTFHAGTKIDDGRLVTNGGRVLAVTSLGDNFDDAACRAYYTVSYINFDGMQYRRDIAARVRK